MFKVYHDLALVRLSNIFRNSCSAKRYHLRNADNKLALLLSNIEFLKKSFSYNGARVWNSLPSEISNCYALPICLIGLFQSIGQISYKFILNAQIVLILVVIYLVYFNYFT